MLWTLTNTTKGSSAMTDAEKDVECIGHGLNTKKIGLHAQFSARFGMSGMCLT
jgi:hypothetical protein